MSYSPRNPNGQGTMANSEPVVLASDQTDVKITLDGETVVIAAGTNNIGDVDVLSLPALPAGTNNIGDVDVLTVPADPFGANADAASATGSISAKLRFIASTGIPITGTVTVGSHAVTNAGTFAVQVDGAALTALQLIDDTVFVDDAAFTPATSKVNAIGLIADETSTDSIDEGDIGAPRMTLDRRQIVTITPNTQNGLTTFHLVSAATTNATNIKASAGQVYGWYIYNSNAAARKIAFHNTAGTPTAGASVFFSIVIPPTSGANVEFTNGIAFSTGIAITTVTGLADNDTAAVALNDLVINIFYK